MRVMGMKPMPLREFREYLRVVKGLLQAEEVEYRLGGVTRTIRFLDTDVINIESRIPIYVAANAPGALRVAGELGNGWMSVGNGDADGLRTALGFVQEGAARAGRKLPDNFLVAMLTTAVVLEPGEKLTSDRVIDESGPLVTSALHWSYENWKQTGKDESIPPGFRDIWDDYCAYVDRMETPPEKRYLQIHLGHCTDLLPEERRFITPEAIRSSVMVGEPDELTDIIRRAERAGLTDLNLMPPRACARKVLKEFAEKVMARY
jgi:alkanesulfonate monooxygenase SsuD/methylene tetrahydromethanopterin reductase-like flavin-dependent oxidoreductase (luciferase family)